MKYNRGDLFFNGPSDPANVMKGWTRNMVVLINDVEDSNSIAQLYSLRDKKSIHLKAFNLAYHFHRVQDHA